jgi:hypothetical protein
MTSNNLFFNWLVPSSLWFADQTAARTGRDESKSSDSQRFAIGP